MESTVAIAVIGSAVILLGGIANAQNRTASVAKPAEGIIGELNRTASANNRTESVGNRTQTAGMPTTGRAATQTLSQLFNSMVPPFSQPFCPEWEESLRVGCPCGETRGKCALCDPTCSNRNPKCPASCKPGCVCLPGKVRTATNGCQPVSICPPPPTPKPPVTVRPPTLKPTTTPYCDRYCMMVQPGAPWTFWK
ncbi:uncharacterized protein LOC129595046 [Paramacrobiotus metropolitanus]|uniref:uncharacterized protein LOC129595046 n=1 Tax=Paramacrobiotus metropolitanus TaxID=2943436 RepID=UPI002445B974|nr:uncharacterized protein LOC129595046 [Paramacrobiotus metropolitanus]